jgi:ribosome-binding factor A
MAASQRQLKISQLIKKQLGEILLQEADLPEGLLASVVSVNASPDLQWADVVLQVYPDSKGAEALKLLESEIYKLQQVLNKRINIKHTPKLRFKLDTSLEKMAEFEKILKQDQPD